jgi:hypothetical protein
VNRIGIEQLVLDVFGPTQTKVINGWVSVPCFLAQWKHETGRDTRSSAGISIQDHDTSVFNCYTCKTKVPLQGLIAQYAQFTGENLDDLIDELEDEAYLGPRELPGWEATKAQADTPPQILDKELHLDLYDSAAGHPYLRKRGITDDTVELLQLKFDPADPMDGEPRILFPVFGPDGDLHGFSGRAIHPDARLKVRDYQGFEKAKCLLGSHLIAQEKPDKVVVVEGLFDYANCWQQGIPGVAVMHSTMTELQARILRDFSLPVYLFYDNDKAGQDGVQIAGPLLYRYIPVMKVRYPEVWIDDDSPEGGHWLKDPGEMIAEDFDAMMADSRIF